MSINIKSHSTGSLTLYMKGAPDRIIKICSKILLNGKSEDLTQEYKTAYNAAYEAMAGKGHRVLAFAQFEIPSSLYDENFEITKDIVNQFNYMEVSSMPSILFDFFLFISSLSYHINPLLTSPTFFFGYCFLLKDGIVFCWFNQFGRSSKTWSP